MTLTRETITREDLQRAAAETFGWAELRNEQLVAMEPVVAGHDVLAVLRRPTRRGRPSGRVVEPAPGN